MRRRTVPRSPTCRPTRQLAPPVRRLAQRRTHLGAESHECVPGGGVDDCTGAVLEEDGHALASDGVGTLEAALIVQEALHRRALWKRSASLVDNFPHSVEELHESLLRKGDLCLAHIEPQRVRPLARLGHAKCIAQWINRLRSP